MSSCIEFDICIIGGGSAGIGAAYALVESHLKVILIEQESVLGGTLSNCNVNRWEPGPDAPFCNKLYDDLKSQKGAALKSGCSYADSLRRIGTNTPVTFNRADYSSRIEEDLNKGKNITIRKNTSFIRCNSSQKGNCIDYIIVEQGGIQEEISAKIFIDATVGAKLCVANSVTSSDSGLITDETDLEQRGYLLGCDPKSFFGECAAPDTLINELNAPDFCFEIQLSNTKTDPKPTSEGENPWGFAYHEPPFTEGKGYIVNPCGALHELTGYELYKQGEEKLRAGVEEMATDFFERFRKYNTAYYDYEIVNISKNPLHIGTRESVRVNCKKMLTQFDIVSAIKEDDLKDFIAIASHPVDIHGSSEIEPKPEPIVVQTYGIPYGCITPKGSKNYFVVSMSAGFSHIATASARLSRTMMQLGYAAAKSAELIVDKHTSEEHEIDIFHFIYQDEDGMRVNESNRNALQEKIQIAQLANCLF